MATAPPTERRLVSPTGAAPGRGLNGAGTSAAAADEAPAAKKGKKKKIMIGGGILAILAAAAYLFLIPSPKPGPPAEGKIVALDSMTLNLNDGHYLKITIAIALVLGKEANFDTTKANELVIDEFSNRAVADVSSNAQRDALKKELLVNLKKAYKDQVFEAYYTGFVTQ